MYKLTVEEAVEGCARGFDFPSRALLVRSSALETVSRLSRCSFYISYPPAGAAFKSLLAKMGSFSPLYMTPVLLLVEV